MKELTLVAKKENISTVMEFVNEQLEALDCPVKVQMQIEMAIDELFGNIARYAYTPKEGDVSVRLEVISEPMSVIITFMDNGVPFDPLTVGEPDTSLSLEEREVGGLGIFLVKKSMDDISYEYKDGKNILSIRKQL